MTWLLILLGTVALGSLTGLLDWGDSGEDVDDADLDNDAPLLDTGAVDALDTALADDPLLAADHPATGEALEPLDITDFAHIAGTADGDLIALPADATDTDAVFGEGGNDVILGNDGDNVLVGGDGDDMLFGRDSTGDLAIDQLFGDAGDDTIAGGDGADLAVGGGGADLIYGGAGNDNLFDAFTDDSATGTEADVINAGDGDDGIVISEGVNLVSLGAGADHVQVYSASADDPVAVITDFDVAEDAILLGVHAADFDIPDGANGMEIGFTLTEVNTDLGPGTLVAPAVGDAAMAGLLSGGSIGHVVLLGVTPDQLSDANIRVVVNSDDTVPSGVGSLSSVAAEMGATRL